MNVTQPSPVDLNRNPQTPSDTTGQQLASEIKEILMHPLLRVVNIPESGGGAILYLSLVITGLEAAQRLGMSSATIEWITEAHLLKDQLSVLKLGRLSAPTSLDMNVKLWGSLHKVIEVRRKARGSTEHVPQVQVSI